MEETKYVFEAKTIQRMELLVLSSLGWRMNPVTPLSFIEHIVRKLGLKTRLHWDFFKRCERLLVSSIAGLLLNLLFFIIFFFLHLLQYTT